MKRCSYCGTEYPDSAVECALDRQPLVSDVPGQVGSISSRPPTRPIASCPGCGELTDYRPAIELRSSFSLAAFFAGGMLAVFFRNAGKQKRFQCNKCETFFSISTPLSKVSLVIFWLLVAPTIIVVLIWLCILLASLLAH